ITDIIAILDQQPRADSKIALRDVANASPPSARVETLADFYLERGLAAGRIGRAKQELDDLNKATEYLLQTLSPVASIYRTSPWPRNGTATTFAIFDTSGCRWRGSHSRAGMGTLLNTGPMLAWQSGTPRSVTCEQPRSPSKKLRVGSVVPTRLRLRLASHLHLPRPL